MVKNMSEQTEYRLASTYMDYSAVQNLTASKGFGHRMPEWPTIMAEREGEPIGSITINSQIKDALVVGPLVASNAFVAKRLVDCMDTLLSNLGIKAYVFYVRTREKRWLSSIRKLDAYKEYYKDDKRVWFRRDL